MRSGRANGCGKRTTSPIRNRWSMATSRSQSVRRASTRVGQPLAASSSGASGGSAGRRGRTGSDDPCNACCTHVASTSTRDPQGSVAMTAPDHLPDGNSTSTGSFRSSPKAFARRRYASCRHAAAASRTSGEDPEPGPKRDCSSACAAGDQCTHAPGAAPVSSGCHASRPGSSAAAQETRASRARGSPQAWRQRMNVSCSTAPTRASSASRQACSLVAFTCASSRTTPATCRSPSKSLARRPDSRAA